jgi:hypothetical protein
MCGGGGQNNVNLLALSGQSLLVEVLLTSLSFKVMMIQQDISPAGLCRFLRVSGTHIRVFGDCALEWICPMGCDAVLAAETLSLPAQFMALCTS